jgi:hypothetical protein
MRKMRLGILIALLPLVAIEAAGEGASVPLRGKLVQQEGKPPAIVTAERKTVYLSSGDEIQKLLEDKRLAGSDFEAMGHFTATDRFAVDPVHTRPVFVYKNGKRLYVTYWCEVCAIRTYSPGKCWCCQQDTHLDFRETEQ